MDVAVCYHTPHAAQGVLNITSIEDEGSHDPKDVALPWEGIELDIKKAPSSPHACPSLMLDIKKAPPWHGYGGMQVWAHQAQPWAIMQGIAMAHYPLCLHPTPPPPDHPCPRAAPLRRPPLRPPAVPTPAPVLC